MKPPLSLVFLLALAGASGAQEGAGSLSDETETLAQIEKLRKQVESLQRQLEQRADSSGRDAVDLAEKEVEFVPERESASHVLTRPWYQNIDLSGFGAVWLADSGRSGTRPDAGFVIKETTLFVEAEVWEDMSFFFEVQTNPLQQDHNLAVRTGEVYAHFHNLLEKFGDDLLGIKVGRIDIPFGEEYLWQDAPDNPLISNTAAYPWLWDEGIALYGRFHGLGWVASVTDGTIARSREDDQEKAVNAKVYGTPWPPLYLSASFMKNGDSAASALLLGGSLFQPVGAGAASSAGTSPSDKVDAFLYEVDARCDLFSRAAFEFSFGQAFVDDAEDAFDRDMTWFSAQSRCDLLAEKLHAALRYSEIGTYDSSKGYHIGGEFLAGGDEAFGYDARRLQRFSLGLGWKITPRAMLKLEAGRDRFEVIDASPFDPDGDDRDFYATELAMWF